MLRRDCCCVEAKAYSTFKFFQIFKLPSYRPGCHLLKSNKSLELFLLFLLCSSPLCAAVILHNQGGQVLPSIFQSSSYSYLSTIIQAISAFWPIGFIFQDIFKVVCTTANYCCLTRPQDGHFCLLTSCLYSLKLYQYTTSTTSGLQTMCRYTTSTTPGCQTICHNASCRRALKGKFPLGVEQVQIMTKGRRKCSHNPRHLPYVHRMALLGAAQLGRRGVHGCTWHWRNGTHAKHR